ncbi:negative elongation factor E-like [Sycon ciliatum]|uniref:negative elongation factor E-like n=1 Tax=Sycon ciliatum TaxID=27933 RepID=UPI0020AED786|eukprot:scpid74044/ scgid19149/ 
MAPPLTKEELELQSKYDLIKRKRQELQQARAAAAPPTAAVSVKRPSATVPVGDIETARRVLESEAKKPRLEKKSDVMVRPLEDDERKMSEAKPFVSVLSGGASGARRDFHHRFISAGRPPASSSSSSSSPRKRIAFGLDERSAHKSASVQVTGCDLTEDLLVNHFGECGEMDLVKVDATGRRGFVTFQNTENAAKAVSTLHNSKIESKTIHVVQIDPEAIQAADFSREALSSPWASLAAGVAVQKKEERRAKREYDDSFSYGETGDL